MYNNDIYVIHRTYFNLSTLYKKPQSWFCRLVYVKNRCVGNKYCNSSMCSDHRPGNANINYMGTDHRTPHARINANPEQFAYLTSNFQRAVDIHAQMTTAYFE